MAKTTSALINKVALTRQYIKALIKWSLYIMNFAFFIYVLPLFLITIRRSKKGIWRFTKISTRNALKIFRIKTVIHGNFEIANDRLNIIISNHKSWFDQEILNTIYPGQSIFFAKKAYFDMPILGFGMRLHSHIPIENRGINYRLDDEIKRRMKEVAPNGALFIYPEGTRNSEDGLLPFKNGAYHIAMKNNANLIPVFIYNCENILKKEKSFLSVKSGQVNLYIDKPIDNNDPRMKSPAHLERWYQRTYYMHLNELSH
jgi:1-acyl-sn-glycerol-3-phosphate acyltransferase